MAGINLDAYFKMIRKEASQKKLKRKMLSQGNDTFDEIKLMLHDFQLKGKPTYIKKTLARKKREDVLDVKPNGVEVGKYNPRFFEIDKRVTSSSFAGRYNFLTDEEREKMKQDFELQEIADRQTG